MNFSKIYNLKIIVDREEHKNHASYCQFIHLNKAECEITFEEMHDLEMYRQINMAVSNLYQILWIYILKVYFLYYSFLIYKRNSNQEVDNLKIYIK